MSRYKLEVMISEELLARIDAARKHEPRASFARRAVEAFIDRDPMTKLVQDGPGLSEKQLHGGMSARTFSEPQAPEPEPDAPAEKPYELPKIAKRKL